MVMHLNGAGFCLEISWWGFLLIYVIDHVSLKMPDWDSVFWMVSILKGRQLVEFSPLGQINQIQECLSKYGCFQGARSEFRLLFWTFRVAYSSIWLLNIQKIMLFCLLDKSIRQYLLTNLHLGLAAEKFPWFRWQSIWTLRHKPHT